MTTRRTSFLVGAVGVLFAALLVGQTIEADGDVKAQGFTGDGANLTGVNSDLLDGMDSAAFAASAHLHSPEEVVATKRKFFLTSAQFASDQALTASTAGYHMASKWDLRDLDELVYDNDAVGAQTPADAGPGEQPPIGFGYRGWIRMGFASTISTGPGTTNCGNWTSTSQDGTVGFLVADSMPIRWGQDIVACSATRRVWRIED